MVSPAIWTLISVGAISLVSLIGAVGLLFGALRKHTVLMGLIALAAGTLLGDSFLHLLPEATHDTGFTAGIGFSIIAGFLVMFTIEVVLRRGHTHVEHAGHHDHVEPFGWINLVGDGLHNLLDGVIIAAAFLVDTGAGIATAVAVLLHEVPQELGDFAVLVRSGMKPKKALMLNLASALIAVIGAVAVFVLPVSPETLELVALPLIAGAFIYIAAADLIPELHHHGSPKDLAVIITGLLVGLAVMAALLRLEDVLPGLHQH